MALYIFDKDGTLVQLKRNWLGIGRPVKRSDEQVVIPGVNQKLKELRDAGNLIAIASNTRAISQGSITLEEAELMMEDCIQKLGGVNAWRICPFNIHAPSRIDGKNNPYKQDNDCRKPKPGMLIALMEEFNIPKDDTVMVGDSWRDERAAQRAEVRFIPARVFFGDEWVKFRVR
jgi:HAD superfamily hydrolase (TIGR01662 family)